MSATEVRKTAITPQAKTDFSFAEARSLIGDLTKPNPRIYWTDFLLSILIGHAAIHAVRFLPRFFPEASWMVPAVVIAYCVTVILYMRALMFTHELIHLPQDGFKGFRFAWNALCGILFLVPSFMYYPHVDHHRRKHYGTKHDGEYVALSHHHPLFIVGFILQALVIPLLGVARFLIISPICWVFPAARRWVHKHASTMVVDPFYERSDASPALMRTVVLQEVLCFLWIVWFLTRYRLFHGEWGLDPFWLVGYSVGIGLLIMNEVRTLGAHRWTNDGGEMTFEEQLVDSVNYPHAPWISELWGPIGTRYHALHHLFPRLPYHNLAAAHQRLVEGLPADSPYHKTIAPSLSSEIVALWKRAAKSAESSEETIHSDVGAAAS